MGSGLVGNNVYKTPALVRLSPPRPHVTIAMWCSVVKAWSLVGCPIHGFMCLSAFSTYKKEGLIWVHSFRDLAPSPLGL